MFGDSENEDSSEGEGAYDSDGSGPDLMNEFPPMKQCALCGVDEVEMASLQANSSTHKDATLKACASCKECYYCTEKCQRQHWPIHKVCCKRSNQNAIPAALKLDVNFGQRRSVKEGGTEPEELFGRDAGFPPPNRPTLYSNEALFGAGSEVAGCFDDIDEDEDEDEDDGSWSAHPDCGDEDGEKLDPDKVIYPHPCMVVRKSRDCYCYCLKNKRGEAQIRSSGRSPAALLVKATDSARGITGLDFFTQVDSYSPFNECNHRFLECVRRTEPGVYQLEQGS